MAEQSRFTADDLYECIRTAATVNSLRIDNYIPKTIHSRFKPAQIEALSLLRGEFMHAAGNERRILRKR